MKSILIASADEAEALRIQAAMGREFESRIVLSPQDINGHLDETSLILLDHEFTEFSGIDFLMEVLSRAYLPVIMLTPPQDAKVAVEAMRSGAYNYIVKAGPYQSIIGLSVREAIAKFNEREQMKDTIVALQQKVAELEHRLTQNAPAAAAPPSEAPVPPANKRINIMEEIVTRFKRGEINLPSLSQIYLEFQKLYKQGAGLQEVSDLLKQDMAISSKLISVSNSTFYRGVAENKTVMQAIGRLGMNTTRRYVEVISNRAIYTVANKKYSELVERLWSHSLACATAAQLTTETLALKLPEDPFTLGLLHDIGKLILLQVINELEINGILDRPLDSGDLLATLQDHHCRFGAALLKKWKFPPVYQETALYHDELQEADTISRSLLVVHFANRLVRTLDGADDRHAEDALAEEQSARLLKLQPETIADIKERLGAMMRELTGHFS